MRDRIAIDDWSSDPAWRARCDPPARWLSTNHLVGEGYWAWLIPLASGAHSVGIVADAKLHPLATMNTFDKAMDWLEVHQPRLFDALDGKRDRLLDFAFLRNFSYGCKQVFSAERWALTGEAGLFLDPFYSPGSDFIAIANTYICELVGRDRAGRPIDAPRARLRPDLPLVLREHARALHRPVPDLRRPRGAAGEGDLGLHLLLGHPRPVLLPAPARRPRPRSSALRDELAHCQALNVAVQALLRAWSAARPLASVANPATMLDQASLPWFARSTRACSTASTTPAFASASALRRGRCAASRPRSATRAGSGGGAARARCSACSPTAPRFGAADAPSGSDALRAGRAPTIAVDATRAPAARRVRRRRAGRLPASTSPITAAASKPSARKSASTVGDGLRRAADEQAARGLRIGEQVARDRRQRRRRARPRRRSRPSCGPTRR